MGDLPRVFLGPTSETWSTSLWPVPDAQHASVNNRFRRGRTGLRNSSEPQQNATGLAATVSFARAGRYECAETEVPRACMCEASFEDKSVSDWVFRSMTSSTWV